MDRFRGAGNVPRMISTPGRVKGLHEGAAAFFTAGRAAGRCVLPGGHKLAPENNTLCCTALRTISRLLDNGISLRKQRLCLNGSGRLKLHRIHWVIRYERRSRWATKF